MRDEIQERCEKFIAKRVAEDGDKADIEVDKADIEDVCACAADGIHSEFEGEWLDVMRSSKANHEARERVDAILVECVQQSGLE